MGVVVVPGGAPGRAESGQSSGCGLALLIGFGVLEQTITLTIVDKSNNSATRLNGGSCEA